MSLVQKVVRRLKGEVLPPLPFSSSEYLNTRVFSTYDEPCQPSARLIHLTLEAAQAAERISLHAIVARPEVQRARLPQRINQWPGEHYRLLAGLVRALQPASVVEIGTCLGWSALAMKQELPACGQIATFDIASWNTFQDTGLRSEDFVDGRLIQHVDDLADPDVAARHQGLLETANLIFMDGPHDSVTEYKMLKNFMQFRFANDPIFVFDDIKMHTLLKFWRDIPLPKLDITSFGHWSGTGIAEWKRPDPES